MLPYAVRSLSSPLESNRRRALRTLAVKASAETPAIDTILDALATDAASLRTLLGWATARSPDENCRVSSPPPDDALVGLAVSMLRRCAARDGGVAALRAVGASALIEGAVKRGAGDDIDRALATLLSEVSSGEASDAGVVASFAAAEAAPFDGVDTEDFSVTSRASLRRSAAPISDPAVRPPSAWEEAGSTLPPAPASEIDETVSAAEGWRFAPVRLCQRDQQQLFELQMAMRMSVENLSLRAGGVSEWIAAQKSAVSSCAEVTALLDAGVPAQALLQGAVGLGSSRPSAGLAVIHGLLSLVRCPLVSLSTSKAHPDQIPVPLAALRALSGVVDRLQRAVAESFDPELAVEVADPDALGRSDADTLVRAVEMQHRLPICHAAATFFCAVAPLLKRHMSSSVERLGAGRSHDASSLPFFALALSTARRLMAMLHEPEALPRRRHVALDRLRISAAMDSLASVALYHNERCVGLLRSAPRATRAMRTQDDEVVPSNAITVALIQLFVDALSTAVDGDDGSRVTRGRGHNALSQIALTAAFSPIVAATRPELHRTATAWLKEHDGGAAWETLSRAQAQAQASSGSVESAVAEEEEVAGPYAPPQESKLASEFVEGWSQLRHGVGVPPPPLAPYDAMARAALEQLSACSTSRSFVDALRTLRAMSGVMPALGRAFADGALPVRDLHPCFARFYEARPIGEGDYLALYEVLLLCEEVVLPSVFGRTDAVSAVVVAARTLQACAALLTQHAAQSFGTDVRRPAVVALDMRAAVLRTACCCAKRAIEAASAEAGASAALKGAAADLWEHATTILFNPELLRVGDSDVLSLDLCLLLLQLGELMSLSSDAEAGAGEAKEAALVQRLVSVASAMDYSDDGEQVSIRAQLKTSTRRVRVAIGCLCILSQREASRACASAWLVSGTTRWCERLAKADDPVVQATATRLLGVFIGDGDPAQSLVDSMIIDSRLSAWVVDSIALACRSDLSWLSRQSSLELGVKALVRLARNAGGDIGESSVEEAESKFTAAWSAVEEDITQLLITGPVASGVKRPGTMQNAVASAACDILCATLHTRPMPCLGALRTAQLSLHGLVGDVLAEQYSVERQAESSAYALAVRSVVLGYCDRQRDATLLTCGRIFLGQRLLWAESAPTSGSSDWIAAALSAIVYISDSKEAASSRASGGPNASVAEAFAEDQAIGLIAAALSVPESTTTLADVPEIARGPAAVSSAYAALGATALARLHACAGKGCSAVAVNRVNLTMRMVAATCGDPVWAQVIGLDGSCATTTADIVNALVLLFCEESPHFAACSPSIAFALQAALECSAEAAEVAVSSVLPATLAKRIQRFAKLAMARSSGDAEREMCKTRLVRCLNVLQSFLSHADGKACRDLPMRSLAEAVTSVWPFAEVNVDVMFALLSATANCVMGSTIFGREFLLHCRSAGATARVINISFDPEAEWSLRKRGMRCLQALSVVSESRLLLIKDGLVERCLRAIQEGLYSGRKRILGHMLTLLAALSFAQDGCRAVGLHHEILFCELLPALLGGSSRRLKRPFHASDRLVSATALLLRNLAFSRVHVALFVEKEIKIEDHARGGALACTEKIGVGTLILMCCLFRAVEVRPASRITVQIAARVLAALRALCHANQKAVAVLKRSSALVRCLRSTSAVLATCTGVEADNAANSVAKLQHLLGHEE